MKMVACFIILSDKNGCLMREKRVVWVWIDDVIGWEWLFDAQKELWSEGFQSIKFDNSGCCFPKRESFFCFCSWPVECFFYCLRLHPMNFIVFVRWLFVSNYFCQNIKLLYPHLKWCLSIFYLWCDKFISSFQLLFFAPFFHCLLLFEEAARVHQCKVRVLALQNEPGVARV